MSGVKETLQYLQFFSGPMLYLSGHREILVFSANEDLCKQLSVPGIQIDFAFFEGLKLKT